jgi:membrane protein DedA with SNARE-associated domain
MFSFLQEIIASFSYYGVAFLMFLENIFPPIPSEVVLPLTGYISAEGSLTLFGAIIAATIGTVVGAYPWYFLGYFFNEKRLKRLASKHGRLITLHPSEIEKVSLWFQKHGVRAVFFGRFLPIFRTLISVPAGSVKMNIYTFTIFTFLGSFIWSAGLIYAGYVLGSNFDAVGTYLDPLSNAVLLIIIVVYIYRVVTFRNDLVTKDI